MRVDGLSVNDNGSAGLSFTPSVTPMQTSRLFIHFVAVAGILTACRDVTAPEFDGTVDFTPNAAAAVSKAIGPEGGSITATGSNGTTFTLVVPEGALAGDETRTITVTPISSFAGMPLRRAVGVQFSPSGLRFLVPAQLTIAYASGSPGRKVVGFGSVDDGSEFHVRPVAVEGSSVRFVVSHFSAAGAGEVDDVRPLSSPGAVGVSAMVNEIAVALLAEIDNNTLVARIVAALRLAYTTAVKTSLEGAAPTDNDLDAHEALSVYAAWSSFVKSELPKFVDIPPSIVVDVQELIAPEIKQADSLATALLRGRINRANELCKTAKSLDRANAVMRWQNLATRYGLATAANGLDNASILLGLCVRVAYQSVTFPQTLTEGQVAQLRLVAGLVYEGGSPIFAPPLSVQVTPTGTTQLSPSVGLTNSTGEYTDGFTPAKPGAQVVLGLHTCVDASQYRRLGGVCADQQVTRGVKPVEISLTPTTATLNPAKTAQFTATVTNASNTSVTWTATGGTITSAGLYTAGSTVGDYEVVARSVADTSKKATAKVSIVPVSTPGQSFEGTYKGTGTWVKGSTTYTGEFRVEVRKVDVFFVGEYEVVVNVHTTPTVPAAYDIFKFRGAIAADGTASLEQSQACFFNGVGPGSPCYQVHDNFTLTLTITGGKATGSFGNSAAGLPGLFTFTNLPKP